MSEHSAILQRLMERIKAPPGVKLELPPPAFVEFQGEFVEYENRRSLRCRFPVMGKHLNPVGRLQGGFLAAAIDNTMGPLSYLAAGRATTTRDLHINYLRGLFEGEYLEVKATVIGRGFDTMLIEAQVFDAKERLVATSSSQVYMLRLASSAAESGRTQ